MKTKKTYGKIIAFVNFAHGYLENKDTPESRLKKSIKSVCQQLDRDEILTDYNEALTDLKLDNALSNPETKALLLDAEKKYQYSAEGQKNYNKGLRALLKQEVEIGTRIHSDNLVIAKDQKLDEGALRVLSGIVISELEESDDLDTEK